MKPSNSVFAYLLPQPLLQRTGGGEPSRNASRNAVSPTNQTPHCSNAPRLQSSGGGVGGGGMLLLAAFVLLAVSLPALSGCTYIVVNDALNTPAHCAKEG